MFMKTIAVGPLEPTAFCVAGGTGVARCRICDPPRADMDDVAALLESWPAECRRDIPAD